MISLYFHSIYKRRDSYPVGNSSDQPSNASSMFSKIFLLTMLAGIYAREGIQEEIPHFRTSGKAVSTQTFIRKDVPLSYQYNSVHEYTTTHPKMNNEEYISQEFSTENKQPLYTVLNNGYRISEPKPLYTKVDIHSTTSLPNSTPRTKILSYGGAFLNPIAQKVQSSTDKQTIRHYSTHDPVNTNEHGIYKFTNGHGQTLVFVNPLKIIEAARPEQKFSYYAVIPKEYTAKHTDKLDVKPSSIITYAEDYRKNSEINLNYGGHLQDKSNSVPFVSNPVPNYYSRLISLKSTKQEASPLQKVISHVYGIQNGQINASHQNP